MTNPARLPRQPYQVKIWSGDYRTLGAFATFPEALALYATVTDRTKQLVNEERAECGRDGLTVEERDEVAAVAYAEELAS
jgi:hypothetical protein